MDDAAGAEIGGCACRGEDYCGPVYVVCLPCGRRHDGWAGGVCVEQSHHVLSGLKTALRSGEQPALSPAICIRREGGSWDSVLLGLRLGSCLNKLRFEIRVNAGERAALSVQQAEERHLNCS